MKERIEELKKKIEKAQPSPFDTGHHLYKISLQLELLMLMIQLPKPRKRGPGIGTLERKKD